MTIQSTDPVTLLTELSGLDPAQRVERLRAMDDGEEALLAMIEEVERGITADLSQALESSRMLAQLTRTLGHVLSAVRAQRVLGQAAAYANQFDDALVALSASIETALEHDMSVEAARGRLTSVHALARLGRFDDAIIANEKAQTAFTIAGETAWAAKADANLGVIHRMRDDPATALTYFDRARAALAAQPMAAAQIDSNRAEALLDLNRFAEAEAAFTRALEQFVQVGANRAAAIVEGNLADLMSRQGRLERALFRFENARRLLESDPAPGDQARLVAEHAETLAGVGLYEEALTDYESAVPRLRDLGMAWEAARAGVGLGRILLRLGRHDAAVSVMQVAADEFAVLGHNTGVAQVKVLQGEAARAVGKSVRAKELLTDAVALLVNRPALKAVAQSHLAEVCLELGDPVAAQQEASAAMNAARSLNLAPLLGDLLHLHARLHLSAGRRDEALSELRAASDQNDRIRGSLQAERFRTAYLGNRSALYEDWVHALLAERDARSVAEAFSVVERARSRSLLDLVKGAIDLDERSRRAVDDPRERALLDQVAAARAELNAQYSRLDELARDDQRRTTHADWQRKIEHCERELSVLEGRLSATRGIGGLFAPSIDATRAQRLVSPSAAIIEYFVCRGRVTAFVVRHDSIQARRDLVGVDEAAEAVERFQFQIARAVAWSSARGPAPARYLDDARRELGELHRMLIEPLNDALAGATKLTIIPHGPLHALPFHATWDGHRHLIEQFECVYAPSASLLEHLRTQPRAVATRTAKVLLVGVSDTIAPLIEREIRSLSAALPGAMALVGPDATAEAVIREAPMADILHLATHGRFSPVAPLSSGLKLADRWLTVRDLYGMRLNASLVTLSGCDTGLAMVSRGDELVGLMRGFFAAGTSALITTLWALNDEIAAGLMAEVYRRWNNERSRPNAGLAATMRQAQRELLRAQPHPAFWAPFILVGDA